MTRMDMPAGVLFACVGVLFPATVALLNFESNRLIIRAQTGLHPPPVRWQRRAVFSQRSQVN
jgi:hypothetical protein